MPDAVHIPRRVCPYLFALVVLMSGCRHVSPLSGSDDEENTREPDSARLHDTDAPRSSDETDTATARDTGTESETNSDGTMDCDGTLAFNDPNLELAVRDAIGLPEGPIYSTDVDTLRTLSHSLGPDDPAHARISDLSGMECLVSLTVLQLQWNLIEDLGPLSHLERLSRIYLQNNLIADLMPLSELFELSTLQVGENSIDDLSPLARLSALEELNLYRNQVSDLGPLAGLEALTELRLTYNRVDDLSPLIANSGIGEGDEIIATGNPLDCADPDIIEQIATLEDRGAIIDHDCE